MLFVGGGVLVMGLFVGCLVVVLLWLFMVWIACCDFAVWDCDWLLWFSCVCEPVYNDGCLCFLFCLFGFVDLLCLVLVFVFVGLAIEVDLVSLLRFGVAMLLVCRWVVYVCCGWFVLCCLC